VRVIAKGRFVIPSITLVLLFSMALSHAAPPAFQAGPAEDYAHLKSEDVVIGAQPFDTPSLQEQAFGKKVELTKYGVLPVLIVIHNNRKTALDVRALEVNLVSEDGRHARALTSEELYALGSPHGRRSASGQQVPLPFPLPKKKNQLTSENLSARTFAAEVLAPGDTASGFVYFEAQLERGDSIYLNGLREAGNRKQLLYFEFPLKESETK
jgi:hypothetical protein